MQNKWQIDYKEIKKGIEEGLNLLEDPELTKNEKKYIKKDLQYLRNFLSGNFEDDEKIITTFRYKSFEQLKYKVLRIMENHYKLLGIDLINFIITLNNEQIFMPTTVVEPKTKLSIDTQAELTIKNYEKHSLQLSKYVQQLLHSQTNVQIQLAENLQSTSFCYYSGLIDKSYLIINPNEAPWILNHEIQHSIEDILGYNTHFLFSELGAIYFETLFLDTLYDTQGFLFEGDYHLRLEETKDYLIILAEYFTIIKIFANMNFQIPTNQFIDIFMNNSDILPECFEAYLKEEIIGERIEQCMIYLFSYLKTLDLRTQTKLTHKDHYNFLKKLISIQRFKYNVPENAFKKYELYLNELKAKTRTKRI